MEQEKTMGQQLQEELLIGRKNIGIAQEEPFLQAAQAFCGPYKDFLDRCKTEREAVTRIVELAQQAGYRLFDPHAAYAPGDKVYRNNRGKALLLCTFGRRPLAEGVRIMASHIDSPRLDLKPSPLYDIHLVDEDGNFVDKGQVELTYPETSGSVTITGTGYGRGDNLDIEAIDIDYTPAAVDSIVVKTAPDKMTYSAADNKFDATGLVITATYDNGNKADIAYAGNEKAFSFDVEEIAYNTGKVEITYGGKTCDLNDIKWEKAIVSISVQTQPTKTSYTNGESFDAAGLVITVTYDDTTTENVDYTGNEDAFSFDYDTVFTGMTKITITYGGETCEQTITVS